jgi:2-C-methyl-D-erythritol 2,4-cyclodiphosphate synthase
LVHKNQKNLIFMDIKVKIGWEDTMRIGIGYDAHRLAPGRPLILGGVHIPFEQGLLGHSDADVLCHALADALLGAAALGDIGCHFPDSDPAWAGASSLLLLQRVEQMLRQEGWRIVNVDSVIIAEKPRLAPFMAEMRERLATALGLDGAAVSVKATTTEGLGFCGAGQGLAAQAVALIEARG